MQRIFENETTAIESSPKATSSITKALLTGGVVAGPLYLAVGLTEALTRPAFDLTRHDLSLLSNGDLGWIHIANLILCGLLVMAGALGMRRALCEGVGRLWGPLLVGLYGLGLIGAGIFVADPAYGFPIGTPSDAHTISGHGLMHFVTGGTGFLGLIAACFVFARRFGAFGQRGWQAFSVVTGVIFLAGFFGIASGSGGGWTLLGFWIAVVLAWAWLSALSVHLRRHVSSAASSFKS
jgi:Protein of unknown function (DUF998)